MSIVQTKTVPLSELRHDPVIMAMPGQEARLKNLDDLMASIPQHGLLQSLKVRLSAPPSGPGQPVGGPTPGYLVTAGNRRLAALQRLWNSGGTIRGEKVTEAFPVPVIHSEETDNSAREQSVAENLQRVPPTPMAEALQYAEMAKHSSEKEIAAHFGVPPKRVAQRLKLATLHPDVQKALEDGKITLEAAQAFTVEPDPAKQAKYLKGCDRDWELTAENIREAFTERLVASNSPLAKLIGKDAYLQAGGVAMPDPFGDVAYWVSGDVIKKLVKAHWAEKIAGWQKAGWAFVAERGEYGSYYYPNTFYVSGGRYTAEQKKGLGVVYWRDGTRDPLMGVVDSKRATPPRAAKAPSAAKPKASLDNPGPSVLTALTEAMTQAVQVKVNASPQMALPLLVAALHDTSGENSFGLTPVKIKGEVRQKRKGKLPQGDRFETALEWAKGQTTPALLAYLAELVAPNVSVRAFGEGEAGEKKAIVDYVDAPIGDRFDANAYFGAVTKDLIVLAYREMTGKALKEGKKAGMADSAAAEAKRTGWLPPQLRTPSYAGPGKVKPAKLAKAA